MTARPGGGQATTVVSSSWGPIWVVASDIGLLAVAIGMMPSTVGTTRPRLEPDGRPLMASPTTRRGATHVAAEAARQIEAYLHGRLRAFELPLDLTGLAAWDRRALRAVATIPFGAVTSYGRLARAVGAPRSGRVVGGAVGRNPFAIIVPCHRVIAADGSLGGYGGRWPDEQELNLARKRALLAHEGVGLPPAGFFEPPQLDGP